MRVTFPHMGNLAITAREVFRGLGLDVVVPPPITKRTLEIGTKYSPEFACLPLKINLGNYLEAAELGADTIIMAGGVGPCRFGYYAQVQREILKDLGYNMDMVVLEPPDAHFSEVWEKIKSLCRTDWKRALAGAVLAWRKTRACDVIEQEVQKTRPLEACPGAADQIYIQALADIDRATTKEEVRIITRQAKEKLRKIPRQRKRPLCRIAVVGEIYTVLEPFVNHHIERRLGRLGVEVKRFLYLSTWINDHLFGGLLRIKGSKKAKHLASPYLNHFVGGHGRESVGGAVQYARERVDGVIQLAPLTCMPEIVAHSIMPAVSKDYDLPVMTIYLDEQTGEAGLQTRLEAFVDLVAQKDRRARSSI